MSLSKEYEKPTATLERSGDIFGRDRGFRHISEIVPGALNDLEKQREEAEAKRQQRRNGNRHSPFAISEAPLEPEKRADEEELFGGLHLLKSLPGYDKMPHGVRKLYFERIIADGRKGLIAKGFKSHIEAIVDTIQRAPFAK